MEISRIDNIGHGIPGPGWRLKDAFYGERFYYVQSGKGWCHFKDTECVFEPDTLYLIPYSPDFEAFFDEDDPIVHSYIDLDIIPPVLTRKIISAKVPDNPFIKSALDIFRQVGKYYTDNDMMVGGYKREAETNTLVEGVVLYLLEFLLKENGIVVTNDEQIVDSLRVIHQRYNEPITVDMLAEISHMNKNYFIRRFSKVVGMTPYAYLKKLRIRVARSLKEDGMSLSEIAEAVGYSDASSLLHAMKSMNK